MQQVDATDRELWESYERALRSLLWRVRARRLQRGVDLLLNKARGEIGQGNSASEGLQHVYSRARAQLIRQLVRRAKARCPTGDCNEIRSDRGVERIRRFLEFEVPSGPVSDSPDFHCDAALGGLARWLRAAGYVADWWPGIDDGALIENVTASSAILLTTDRRMLERSVLIYGVVPSLLIPNTLTKRQQFTFVVSQLDLPRKDPRCMSCGGPLRQVAKSAVRHRIPRRTYTWRNDYYLCGQCNKLYWEGTHWQRIEKELAAVEQRRTSSAMPFVLTD